MRGSRPHNPNADHIEIDGIWFYKEGRGKYYLGNVKDENGKPKPTRAHHYVWKKYNGEIPKGFAVHHIDHNPRNNDISNLVLMNMTEHASMHSLEHSDKSRENMLNNTIPAAALWHKSEDAAKWHRDHYEKITREKWMKPITLVCQQCGKEYETKQSKHSTSRFCSNNCRAKWRRASGVDNETRNCVICNAQFVCNRYSRQSTCGNKTCVKQLRYRRQSLSQ